MSTRSALGLGGRADTTQTGAGPGAAARGAIGSLSGDFGWGALIGARLGTGGGYLHDQSRRGG